jgi:hypothetical protein
LIVIFQAYIVILFAQIITYPGLILLFCSESWVFYILSLDNLFLLIAKKPKKLRKRKIERKAKKKRFSRNVIVRIKFLSNSLSLSVLRFQPIHFDTFSILTLSVV